MAFAFGYTNQSWTLGADLTCEQVCKLLEHMDRRGYTVCTPRNRDPAITAVPFADLTSGYVLRAIDQFPKQGSGIPGGASRTTRGTCGSCGAPRLRIPRSRWRNKAHVGGVDPDMRALFKPCAAALAALALACTASAAPVNRIPLSPLPDASVGRVAGSRAFIALSVKDGKLRVYVCDGTLKRDATISTWFRHHWDGRRALTVRAGGHTLKIAAVRRDGRITGRLDGARFTAKAAKGLAGLFKGRDTQLRTTWIVLPSHAKRGTFIPTRPPKCRVVLVTGSSGQQQWVTVC